MKPSEILIKAAEHIAERKSHGCCFAIWRIRKSCTFHVEGAFHYLNKFKPKKIRADGYWWDTREKDISRRYYILCAAAAIAKREGN